MGSTPAHASPLKSLGEPSMRIAFVLACVLLVPVTVAPQGDPTRVAPRREPTMRPEIVGQHGIVAGGRHYSVHAGTRILEQGGNAIDAGVATVFAASVVEISHFGFGGEVPTMIYDAKTKQVVVINGQGTAPKAASPETFKAKGKVDANGPLGATLPAVMDAMAIALEHFGTMRLEQVMAPAIELADGFPMYAFLRDFLVSNKANTTAYKWGHLYYANDHVPDVGEIFRQPNLARTLRTIVAAEHDALQKSNDHKAAIRAGRDAFYKGDIARRIAEADRAEGGLFTYEDLANFHGSIEKPATTTYRGYQVYKAGPWNQGPVLLETLNILEGTDLKKMGRGSADFIHTVHEAIKLAYDDRNAYLGDPAFASVPIAGLLSKPYAATRRALIGPKAFLDHRPGDPYAFDATVKPPAVRYQPHSQGTKGSNTSGDTTCVDVVDKDGNLFSATPSSGWLLGGAFIAGETGVPLSNRMQVFDLDPLSPNVLVGGKRPRTTLTPTIVLKDGTPFLAISTPGGDSQDQQILNVLLNMMDFDMDLQAAIEAPRINSDHPHSSFDNHESVPGQLEIENRVPAKVMDDLRSKGHVLRVVGPYGMSTGVVAVGVNPKTGTLRGGADPRRERYAFGW
ncbi:MAG: gamma-glutamyltransferase family protein [Acidobacteria bacterium]|nr:gamma-glutamyltransferase family protein [Acidobacteriota bacterium]